MNFIFGLAVGLSFSALSVTALADDQQASTRPVASLHGLKLTFLEGEIRTNCSLKTPELCKTSENVWVSSEIQNWLDVRVREDRYRREILGAREDEERGILKVLAACPRLDSAPVTKQDSDLEVGCKSALAALARVESHQEIIRRTLDEIAVDPVIFDEKLTNYKSATGFGFTLITDQRRNVGQKFVVPLSAGTSSDASYMFSAGRASIHVSPRNPMEIVAKTKDEIVVGKCEATPGARYLFGRKIPFSDETQIVCTFANGVGFVRLAVR